MSKWRIRSDLNQNGSQELHHYGVLGMKWGVRRTPEQLGHHKIKKGTVMYRATVNPNEDETGSTYVTYLEPDRDMYRGYYGNGLKKQAGLGWNVNLYESSYTLKEDLNVPSRAELDEVTANVAKNNRKYLTKIGKDYVERTFDDNFEWSGYDYGSPDYVKAYKKAGKEYLNSYIDKYKSLPVGEQGFTAQRLFGTMPELKNDVIAELKKRGYNAMVDEASVGGRYGWEKEGVEPLIIFDRKASLDKLKSEVIDRDTHNEAVNRYVDWNKEVNSTKNRKEPW